MRFWKRKRRAAAVPERPGSKPASGKRFPVEVKVLAARAKEAGLGRSEVAQLVGASVHSIDQWAKLYREGGPEALIRQGSHPSTRRICDQLSQRIERYRQDNPEAGARRRRRSLPTAWSIRSASRKAFISSTTRHSKAARAGR